MYYFIANRWEVARAEEPDNFLTDSVPEFFLQAAPAPYYFPKQLRLRLLVFFFKRFRLKGAKNTRLCGSGSRLLVKFGEIFFPSQTRY